MTREFVVEADGGSRGNPGPAGFGALVRDAATRVLLEERAGYVGHTTNNVAEYSGLIAGLRAARELDPEATIHVRMDSKLVVEQMSGRWKIKNPEMRALAGEAREAIGDATVDFTWIPRESNTDADRLANEAMDTESPDIRRSCGPLPVHPHDAPVEIADRAEPKDTFVGEARGRDDARKPLTGGLWGMREDDLVSPLAVVLVRHGVTDATLTHALSGSSTPGPPLNAQGRVQAAKAADAVFRIGRDTWERVPPVSKLVASPMVRTRETAAALGRRLGLRVEIDDRLRELDFGEWEGLTGAAIGEMAGDDIHRWRFGEIPAPGGESMSEVGARMTELVEQLAAAHAAECMDGDDRARTIALVSHAVAIKSCVGQALNVDLRQWASIWPSPASLTIMQFRVTASGEIAERHLLCLGAPVH